MRPVVLLHLGGRRKLRVDGLLQGFDVVFALDLDRALGDDLVQWSQEALLTTIDLGAGALIRCGSYGAAWSRGPGVYGA